MKKLLKAYGLNSDMQYFERIVFLMGSGDIVPGITMFEDMPKPAKITFLKSATIGSWESGLSKQSINYLFESL